MISILAQRICYFNNLLPSLRQYKFYISEQFNEEGHKMFSKSKDENLKLSKDVSVKPAPRRSLLHDDIVIKGDWQSDGVVEFGGEITGDLTVDILVVTGTGKVDGNVRARSVTVEGSLKGTISALEVVLSSTAIFTGEIVAESIRIDFGANVEGHLKATAKDTA